jgi:hypothetical protein
MGSLQHRFYKGNGNVAITIDDFSANGPDDVYVREVRVHLSAAGGANTMTLAVESDEGVEFNAVLGTQDMTAVTDKVFTGQVLRAVDHLTLSWTNASNRIYGIEVIYRPASEWD